MMSTSHFRSLTLMVLMQALISGYQSQTYKDLEVLGINCPSRDRCLGRSNDLTHMDRSCECDYNCTAYQDCCIDAPVSELSRPPVRTDVTCLHYGEQDHTGVYVISKCSSNWDGPSEVREKCVGSDDLSDPLTAVPVTDVAQKETYRNLACAECNNANLAALKTFQMKIKCRGLKGITEKEIIANLTYNQERRLWGVNRRNSFGNAAKFFGCDIIFDVPGNLYNSVRFCRPNLISECATDYNHPEIETLCAQYMAVVYSDTHSYRNPHCAICNHKTVDEVSCRNKQLGRQKRARRPFPFKGFDIDLNLLRDVDSVGNKSVSTPACPSDYVFDPFMKRCRRLVCARPGYVVVNGRCWKG